MYWDVTIEEDKYTLEAGKSWEAKVKAALLHKEKHTLTTPTSYIAYGAKVKRHEDRRYRYIRPVPSSIRPTV